MDATKTPATLSPIVPMEPSYDDARGSIQPLVSGGFESAQLITCTKGSVRANHYHRQDSHHCYMVYGSMRYYYRPVGSDEAPKWVLVVAGQTVYTPPMEDHAMEFLEDSAFINFAGRQRDTKSYEDDLVRVPLIPVENGFSPRVVKTAGTK